MSRYDLDLTPSRLDVRRLRLAIDLVEDD